jgi:NAD+ synthase (glutamine-hydrolysing)
MTATAQQLRVAVAQINLLVGDMEGNARRIAEVMHQARDTLQADILITPELALTGYPPEDLLLRPGMYERIEHALVQLQHQVSGIDLLLGYPEHTPHGIYNSVAVIREGKIIAHARKDNLPNYSVFDEKRYFVPDHGSCVISVRGVQVGITICEDIWFPEPAQRLKEAGAQLILNINASPYHVNKGYEREQVVADRCRETGLPVLYANLVGGQDELVFDGDSFVMDSAGVVTQRLPAFQEKLELVRFEPQPEGAWQPEQAEALPAPLSTVASVYQALVLGVRDFVRKNGFNGVVIGLSGGIDSALTLAIAVDALGADEIEAVMMPSRYTADMSVEDAAEEARTLNVTYHVIPIKKVFDAFLEILADEFAGLPVDTTEENIQARCRGLILMAISNKKRKMVLTTGNKSEMAVGYATLYGDMAGGFDVLKDVPKTLVYELANYRNSLSGVIPQRVIDRPPSAELAPDQQDTDSLPPYEILDSILEMYVEKDMGVDDIVAKGYERDTVERVTRMVSRNEYKRRQAPPGIRITQRAFGRDRRYPITSGYVKRQ